MVASRTPSGRAEPDWTVQVVDTIESVVGTVRNKTTVPIETIARALVYGTLAGAAGAVALVLVSIAMIRILEVYLPVGGVWLPYLIVGGLFSVVGLFLLLAKAHARPQEQQ